MTRAPTAAALAAAAALVVAALILLLRPDDDKQRSPLSTPVRTTNAVRTVTTTPGRPIGPPSPRPAAPPAAQPPRRNAPLPETEAAGNETAPTPSDLPAARAITRRFAAAWLAHAVGRAPITALTDALPRLRRRLDVVRGRDDTTAPRPPTPTAELVSLRRQSPSTPSPLVAQLRVRGTPELQAAELLVVWWQGRWRVSDLAPR